jgi:SAM-dependent methyltransferase
MGHATATAFPASDDGNGEQAEAPAVTISLEEQLIRMREDWDRRASENARYYVATAQEQWSDEEFYASGEETLRTVILNDMTNIGQGKDPADMRVLEIGCGAGRVTRALAGLFGQVHAVDISGEMVRLARDFVKDFSNAFIYQNNGMDLSVVPAGPFDFAFSRLVFQHIPSRDVIQTYVNEVYRLLRPGALFKFQLQGCTRVEEKPDDTWVGVPSSEEQAMLLAANGHFESRYRVGIEQQEFWNWFFKPG